MRVQARWSCIAFSIGLIALGPWVEPEGLLQYAGFLLVSSGGLVWQASDVNLTRSGSDF